MSTGGELQIQLLTERKHLHLYCVLKKIPGQIIAHYQVLPTLNSYDQDLSIG